MNPVQCIAEEALGEVLALPADDPRRSHLDTCPRCHALVLSYQGFLAPDANEALAYGTHEAQALDRARERLLGVAPTEEARPVVERPSRPWWAPLAAPQLRPVFALAAIAVVTVAIFVAPQLRRPAPSPLVRGLGDRPMSLAEPAYGGDGSVRLVWRSSPEAQRYEVRFFSMALEPIGQADAGGDTTVTLSPARLPAAYGHGELVLYRVAALRGRDQMAISETRPIQRP
jgi:hypothetical protein